MRIVMRKSRATCLCNEDVPYTVRPITGEKQAEFMVTVVHGDIQPPQEELYRLTFTEAGGLEVSRML
jgi:hypothetical protein